MYKIFGFVISLIFALNSNAQSIVNDSATTSADNTGMTFYSLQTGQKTVAANNDWHIAVSVRPSLFPDNTLQGTTIRINEAFGVQAYLIPGFTADSFYVPIDTVGFHIWERIHDSDSVLDQGAFNTGKNIAVFNYGWGVYSGPPNHNVDGNKIYLVQLPNRSLKKVWIQELDRDTAWDIKVANLDNSNLETLHFAKATYAGKNFVYINLLNNAVLDKEPLSTDWDLQFLQYAASDVKPGQATPAVGVWANKGTNVAKREYADVSSNNYSNLTFSTAMNTIGWNWKYLLNNLQSLSGKDFTAYELHYSVEDSLSYFIQTQTGDIYKVIFTAYDGPSTGMIHFSKEKLSVSSVAEIGNRNNISASPNPCNSALNVVLNTPSSELKVFDITGKMITDTRITNPNFQVNTSAFANGVYLLMVISNGTTSLQKFVVSH